MTDHTSCDVGGLQPDAVWNPLDRSIIYVVDDELPPRGNSAWWAWFLVALVGFGLIGLGVLLGPSSSLGVK